MTVAAVGLLAAQDLLARRRTDPRLYAGALIAAALAAGLHTVVGQRVGMTGAPAGGSRLAQAWTMGPVVLRYLASFAWPPAHSLVHDVPVLRAPSALALLGLGLLGLWGLWGLARWRRCHAPLALATWLAFAVPLAPVSQVLFPLQNQMADRYLFLSLLAPAAAFGALFASHRAPHFLLAALTLTALGVSTGERAWVLASSQRAFADATAKTRLSPVAPYQLASALDDAGATAGALRHFETALARSRGAEEVGRRATNNLARLRVQTGDLLGAEAALRAGRARWPDDPKLLENLVKVLSRQGRHAEARAVFDELERRFPGRARER